MSDLPDFPWPEKPFPFLKGSIEVRPSGSNNTTPITSGYTITLSKAKIRVATLKLPHRRNASSRWYRFLHGHALPYPAYKPGKKKRRTKIKRRKQKHH